MIFQYICFDKLTNLLKSILFSSFFDCLCDSKQKSINSKVNKNKQMDMRKMHMLQKIVVVVDDDIPLR